MAGPRRSAALERRGVRLAEEATRGSVETSPRGAARALGVESGAATGRRDADRTTAVARRARRIHSPLDCRRHPVPEGGSAMTTYQLDLNGQRREVTVDPSTPLLWVLREELKLTATSTAAGSARAARARFISRELQRARVSCRYR